MEKVLDASALMAYLEKEPGYEKVKDLFVKASETGKNLLMSAVNWGEVIYVLMKYYGAAEADRTLRLIETFPVDIIPVDTGMARQAALYKAGRNLPYADCFAAALAKLRRAELVTGDKEFKAVESEIKISWI